MFQILCKAAFYPNHPAKLLDTRFSQFFKSPRYRPPVFLFYLLLIEVSPPRGVNFEPSAEPENNSRPPLAKRSRISGDSLDGIFPFPVMPNREQRLIDLVSSNLADKVSKRQRAGSPAASSEPLDLLLGGRSEAEVKEERPEAAASVQAALQALQAGQMSLNQVSFF